SPFTLLTINNPIPSISSILPSATLAGGASFTITVIGSNFTSASVVNFNGASLVTTFVSSTQLTAVVAASSISGGTTALVNVFNPLPGGGFSAPISFTILNPIPAITRIVPAVAAAGSAATVISVSGSNFTTGSVVMFNGAALATTFLSSTQLTAL